MSTYKKLTKELLDACKEMLIKATEQDLTRISIRYMIILLYEYCTCYAYLQMHTAFIDSSVNIALKSLKQYCCKLLDNDIANRLCSQFYSTRNSFAHITESLFDDLLIIELLNTNDFYTLLGLFDLPESVLQTLRNYAIEHSGDSDQLDYTQHKVGDAIDLLSTVSIGDCTTPEDFNPFDYIRQKVGDYINLLPVASVCDCKTPEDCQDLIDSLAHLF